MKTEFEIGLIFITVVSLLAQYVIFFMIIMHDEDQIRTKKDFYLWLIPYFMPLKLVYEMIKERFDELD